MTRVLDRTRIRPRVVQDGGDILFDAWFPETGEVVVRMIGACEDCPSSTLTLKQGVERYVVSRRVKGASFHCFCCAFFSSADPA